jgi:hypothetical protein
MNEHRRREVAVAEHCRDVRQVGTNRCGVCRIVGVVRSHFNNAAIGQHSEVMSCLIMRKAHRLIAVTLQDRLM